MNARWDEKDNDALLIGILLLLRTVAGFGTHGGGAASGGAGGVCGAVLGLGGVLRSGVGGVADNGGAGGAWGSGWMMRMYR